MKNESYVLASIDELVPTKIVLTNSVGGADLKVLSIC